ncbi:type I-U CRISPR-associated helicase/endonuclease Cas3 [Gemmatimonas sp.]|uniref:type I-G CRISPR-associated helicase/endonuclease Cas3g n=1 Tax=Gemmatimonas sp. TaxID=1962908 RepID=UPI0037BF00B7
MSDIAFADFYRALWSRDPFPWQERLANTVAQHGWPDALDIPTGCGKTSTIDIALWHLATAPSGIAPRRIVYVVDRRLVVDGTARHAQAIAEAITSADSQSVLGFVADRLRALARDNDPLRVMTLRGGVPRDHAWVANPLQPMIVLSTVDQVGSRLLFRGYGVSHAMLPVHAALLANDSVVLLDEAHLSEPFRQTLAALEPHVAPPRLAPSVPPLRSVLLSATLPAGVGSPFSLDHADRACAPLIQRLRVQKLARLVSSPDQDDQFTKRMADQVLSQLQSGALTVLAVVNRVARARRLFDALRSESKNDAARIELLIGPSRGVVRDERTQEWVSRVAAGRDRGRSSLDTRPFVLVATQCVEAGVDFDFDALTTESAPLDALRQRFGRLDRLGLAPNGDHVRAAVVHRQRRNPDPVYGARIEAAWAWLTTITKTRSGADTRELGVVDFGVDALREHLAMLSPEEVEALVTERPDAPLLLPHHLEAWADTTAPGSVPAPSLFLHGPRGAPSIRLGWRADLERTRNGDFHSVDGDEATRVLTVLPPAPGELIELQLATVRRWLERSSRPVEDVESDVPVAVADDGARTGAGISDTRSRVLYRRRFDGTWEAITVERVRPGDLLMAAASTGGCDAYGWNPEYDGPVTDVAEQAHEIHRGEWVRRLHPQCHATLFSLVERELHNGATEPELLAMLRDRVPVPSRLSDRISFSWYVPDQPAEGLILSALLPRVVSAAEGDATEGDDGSFGQRSITLEAHSLDVVQWVTHFTDTMSLHDVERRALHLAARWHDVGKSDPEFQAMLRGETTVSRFDTRPLLAKSAERPTGRRRAAGLPRGWRHEVLSVVMAEPLLVNEAPEVLDLALWLIATHHGRGRLTFDDVPPTPSREGTHTLYGIMVARPSGSSAESIAAAHMSRGERLTVRYGAHTLAWLETLLRLADHRASAHPGNSGGAA